MKREEMSLDEKEIIDGWRIVKQHRKGYIHAVLKSDGTQFYLEITPAKEGKVVDDGIAKKENA